MQLEVTAVTNPPMITVVDPITQQKVFLLMPEDAEKFAVDLLLCCRQLRGRGRPMAQLVDRMTADAIAGEL